MKLLSTAYCRLFKQIIPSVEGQQLLKEGKLAIKQKDFQKA